MRTDTSSKDTLVQSLNLDGGTLLAFERYCARIGLAMSHYWGLSRPSLCLPGD
jgi:hypothetical protein